MSSQNIKLLESSDNISGDFLFLERKASAAIIVCPAFRYSPRYRCAALHSLGAAAAIGAMKQRNCHLVPAQQSAKRTITIVN